MRHEGDVRRSRAWSARQGRTPTHRRGLAQETGGILAISAALLPMLLVLCALVIDVGNWFTHKRQLQNRADAAALAAGVEYGNVLGDCLQTTDATAKNAAAAAITAQARRYAGDPAATDPMNTEIADQTKLDVLVNSNGYGAATDGSDGGDPCFDHAGDDVSPGGGQWTDVRVVERDLPSLFGVFGLPLSRNGARARVEIRPAVSDNGFIPLAIPETEIVKAQLRYVNHCTSPPTLLGQVDLKPLAAAYQTVTGTVLWAPDTGSPNVTPSGLQIDVPPSTDCALPYVPIGAEVRVAGRSSVDFTQSCAVLAAARFADCWSRLSELRAWKTTRGPSELWIQDVELTSSPTAPGCAPDAYFARNAASCAFGVRVNVDWGDRDDAELNVPANFVITVNGTPLRPVGEVTGWWASQGAITVSTRGPAPVTLSWSWADSNPTHTWDRGPIACTNGNNTPCRDSASGIAIHRTFLADDLNAGIVDMVRTSGAAQPPAGSPLTSLSSIPATGMRQLVFPTVGLRSALTAGQYRVLRAAGPQGNQSVDCEPTGGQGHDFDMFMTGCDPYYGFNRFGPPDLPIWWSAQDACPRQNEIFAQPNGPSDREAWKCVPAAPGFSPGVIADGIAARTGNCTGIQSNTCNRTACLNPSNYPDTPDPNWVPPLGDPRVVSLFVVPYGAFKGVNAADGLPITKFPKFYVTGWGGNGANRSPCPDDDPAEPGEIVGYFIAFGQPGGPVDETLKCIPGDLTPCRAVLVR